MGTRNLTIVRSKNRTKVAQYGQWDGYPTGQGQTIAYFLNRKDFNLTKFKRLVNRLEEYTEKEIEDIYEKAGAEKGAQYVSMDIVEKVKEQYPELSRDTGAEILDLIYDGKVKKVHLLESFKEDTLFCEYCYEIDLDKQTVTMNDKEYTFFDWTRPNFMEKLEK